MPTNLVLLVVIAAHAQDWQNQVDENGLRTARVSASGSTPDGPATTTLTVQCRPGKDGAVSILYAISATEQMKKFNFGDFEGPGAPASKRKLVRIVVQTQRGAVTVQTPVSGYRIDQGTFVFQFAARTNMASQVTRVTDAIRAGAETISVTVQDSRNTGRTIQTRFPGAHASFVLAETMKGCGKP